MLIVSLCMLSYISLDKIFPVQILVRDINEAMLDVGCKRAQKFGFQQGDCIYIYIYIYYIDLQMSIGNAEKLDLESESQDFYTVAFGVRNITNREIALKEAHRVLKPGGKMLILEMSKVEVPVIRELYGFYAFEIVPLMGKLLAKESELPYTYLVESAKLFPSQEEFSAMLREAGFEHVVHRNLMWGVVAIHIATKANATIPI